VRFGWVRTYLHVYPCMGWPSQTSIPLQPKLHYSLGRTIFHSNWHHPLDLVSGPHSVAPWDSPFPSLIAAHPKGCLAISPWASPLYAQELVHRPTICTGNCSNSLEIVHFYPKLGLKCRIFAYFGPKTPKYSLKSGYFANIPWFFSIFRDFFLKKTGSTQYSVIFFLKNNVIATHPMGLHIMWFIWTTS
jgi:hypothetical protein